MKIDQIHKLFLECSTVDTDTRKINLNSMFFALKGENFNANKFAKDALDKGVKFAIVDEKEYAINKNYILVDDVLNTLQKLANYHRNFLGTKIIGLTGSNGKTTTKELINAVLSQQHNTNATVGNLNNHIGVPLTLLSLSKETEIGIVEMGANHQKEIEFLCGIAQPDFGYITNFGKAHLEGFGGVEGVIKGKSELYSYLQDNNKLIFVNDSDAIQKEKTSNYNKKYTFGMTQNCDSIIELLSADPFVKIKTNNTHINSNLIGSYNFNNIAIAITIGKYFNVSLDNIKKGIENYIPTNNRSQIINKDTNKIILDAYNANPTSMKAALDNFTKLSDTNKIAVLGDMFELGNSANDEHKFIVDYASQLNINNTYLVGKHFYENKITKDNLSYFKSFDDLKLHFENLEISNTTFLIKGSRGMALERLLDIF